VRTATITLMQQVACAAGIKYYYTYTPHSTAVLYLQTG